MLTFNSIEPQRIYGGASSDWITLDLSYEIPEGATGAIVQIRNTSYGNIRNVGMRKPGSTVELPGKLVYGCYTWGLVGCDDSRRIQVYSPGGGEIEYYIMGYTGLNVHYLAQAINFTPPENVWADLDCSPYIPANADAVIFNVSAASSGYSQYAIRKKGSTDDHYSFFYQNYPILGTDVNGKVKIRLRKVGPAYCRACLIGYIIGGITMHTNSIDISPAIFSAWRNHQISSYGATTHYAIVETNGIGSVAPWGIRKSGSLREITAGVRYHQWAYPHCNVDRLIQMYREDDFIRFYEIGVVE
ncbi:hypothetical protein ES703_87196 [subsurface metagenome]